MLQAVSFELLVFRSQLFESYGRATPLLRSYIGDGLGKCPAMPGEILRSGGH